MWELDCEESWAPKNWCFWTVVLEETLESPLDCKEIQPVHPKGDPSWVLIGRPDAEAETPVLWPPRATSWLIGKGPDAGRDWGQQKGTTEDAMSGWHQRLNGHVFEEVLGVCDGQGDLECCDSWGCKEWDSAEQLNWNSKEEAQLHPSTENWIKDLLNMALPIRTRPSVPHSQSVPSGSLHKLLILVHQRANRLKATEWLYHFNILRGNMWEI